MLFHPECDSVVCVTIVVFVREYDSKCESKYELFPKRPLIPFHQCSSTPVLGGATGMFPCSNTYEMALLFLTGNSHA